MIEEYKQLIINSEGNFDIQEGSTFSKEHNVTQTFSIENLTYNGYLSPRDYKVKLQSLSILLEFELKKINELKELGLSSGGNLKSELMELESNFREVDNTVIHKRFRLTQSSRTNNIKIEQHHFEEFIIVAYESIKKLNSLFQLGKNFKSLFVGGVRTVNKNIEFVNQALVDLRIVNEEGKSILSERGKSILWALIDVLKEKGIIKQTTEEVYISIIWNYIKGNNKPPIKPHRTGIYVENKVSVIKYFKNNYLANDN